MTRILSWNIQNGKGMDGKHSLERVAETIKAMPTADAICLQEVSRGLHLDARVGRPDQVAELADLFPGYEIVFGSAIDALCPDTGGRWQFGNAVLTTLPLLSVATHPLPRPAAGGKLHMNRQATEVVVAARSGPLRIVNVHLEYHSVQQRLAQIERLRELQQEVQDEKSEPPRTNETGPYQHVPRPADGIVCGDFNMTCDSDEYQRLLEPLAGESKPFHDAWKVVHPDLDHAPTCGIYDHQQWPEGAHCRDFFFLTGRCVRAARDMRVDTVTDASDHQPLMIELSD